MNQESRSELRNVIERLRDGQAQRVTADELRRADQEAKQAEAAMEAAAIMAGGDDDADLLPPMPEEPAGILFPINSEAEIVAGHHKVFKQGSWGVVEGHDDSGIMAKIAFKRVNNQRHCATLPVRAWIPKNVLKRLAVDGPRPGIKKIIWESVILTDEIKRAISSCVVQAEHWHKMFDEWGAEDVFEKGRGSTLLLSGKPGTGKTLVAEALGWQLKREVLIANTGTLQDSRIGEFEKNIGRLFKKAKNQNCIILMDEADSLVSSRDMKGPILSAETNYVLTEIERFDGVCIFTTNRMEDLDEAVERRITLKLEIPEPNEEMRRLIWRRMIPTKAPVAPEVDTDILARAPLTGGMIKNVVLNALRSAIFDKSERIEATHFMDALSKEVEAHRRFEEARASRRNRHIVGRPFGGQSGRLRERLNDFAVNISGVEETA